MWLKRSGGFIPPGFYATKNPLTFTPSILRLLDGIITGLLFPRGWRRPRWRLNLGGYPKGTADNTELTAMVSEQYVELPSDYLYLMIHGAEVGVPQTTRVHIPEKLTLLATDVEEKEIEPAKEGYRTYTYETFFGDGIAYYYIFAGDYMVDTAWVGDLEIRFAYFKNKERIMREVDAIGVIRDAVAYFTDLYGPLDFGGEPLMIMETERDGFEVWQLSNFCGIGESAIVSSLYQAEKTAPDTARSAGIESLVSMVAKKWWGYYGGAQTDYEWTAQLTNYSTYLYIKHLYGEEYTNEMLKKPWYQAAEFQRNAFYYSNKDYMSILPSKDAVSVYLPYQNVERKYARTMGFLHMAEVLGRENVLAEKLSEIFLEWTSEGLTTGYRVLPALGYEILLVKIGVTEEEF